MLPGRRSLFLNLASLLNKFFNRGVVRRPLLFLSLFLVSCSGLFYYPDSNLYTTPDRFNLKYESFYFNSTDGTKLHGWILPAQGGSKTVRGTVLMFHGNAQNLSSHFLNLAWMSLEGFQLVVFDYQGYGESDGSPDQERLNGDAVAALNYAYKLWKNGGGDKFVVYGQSLGGAISLRALKDFKLSKEISLMVLDSTFYSYQDMVFNKMTSMWTTFLFSPLAYVLFSDKYAADKVFGSLPDIPVLVIHGTADNVVEYKTGKELFEKIPFPRKIMWQIDGGVHTDVFFEHERKYRKKFIDLIRSAPWDRSNKI